MLRGPGRKLVFAANKLIRRDELEALQAKAIQPADTVALVHFYDLAEQAIFRTARIERTTLKRVEEVVAQRNLPFYIAGIHSARV